MGIKYIINNNDGTLSSQSISGKLSVTSLQITSGSTPGYVLTALDSDGNMNWQVPTGGGTFTGGTVAGGTNFTNGVTTNSLIVNGVNASGFTTGSGTVNYLPKWTPSGNTLGNSLIYEDSSKIYLSAVTIDLQNNRLGINITSPQYVLDAQSEYNNSRIQYWTGPDSTEYASGTLLLSGSTGGGLPRFQVSVGPPPGPGTSAAFSLGIRSFQDLSYPALGKPGDSFIYSSVNSNGLNIISQDGTVSDDYIRFYAGGNPGTKAPDMYIQGSGTTKGYVGLGTETPTQKLHVSGSTRVERNFDGDTSVSVVNNDVGGTSTRSVVSTTVLANSGGNTLTGIFATSAYNTDLTGSSFGDGGTGYLKNATTLTIAGTIPGRGSINIGVRDANKFLRFFSGNQNFDNLSLRGSLNSDGYWGFGQNMTGQTATVHIKGYSGFYPLKVDSDLNSPIIYADSNGNVGIGISSPSQKLDVNGTTKTTNLSATTITASTLNLNGSQIETAWTSYVPTWTASTSPSIGDGVIEGYYKLIGKTCFVRGNIQMGTTTTYGTGEWLVGLPFPAKNADGIQITVSILQSTVAWYNGIMNGARAGYTDKTAIQYQNVGGTTDSLSSATPFAWTNGSRFVWNGSYEIA